MSGPRRDYGTVGGPGGHSGHDAVVQARQLVDDGQVDGMQLLVVPLPPGGQVKLIGRDLQSGEVVYYTEVSRADADTILELFRARPATAELDALSETMPRGMAIETLRMLRHHDRQAAGTG